MTESPPHDEFSTLFRFLLQNTGLEDDVKGPEPVAGRNLEEVWQSIHIKEEDEETHRLSPTDDPLAIDGDVFCENSIPTPVVDKVSDNTSPNVDIADILQILSGSSDIGSSAVLKNDETDKQKPGCKEFDPLTWCFKQNSNLDRLLSYVPTCMAMTKSLSENDYNAASQENSTKSDELDDINLDSREVCTPFCVSYKSQKYEGQKTNLVKDSFSHQSTTSSSNKNVEKVFKLSVNPVKVNFCTFCGITFKDEDRYRRHLLLHTNGTVHSNVSRKKTDTIFNILPIVSNTNDNQHFQPLVVSGHSTKTESVTSADLIHTDDSIFKQYFGGNLFHKSSSRNLESYLGIRTNCMNSESHEIENNQNGNTLYLPRSSSSFSSSENNMIITQRKGKIFNDKSTKPNMKNLLSGSSEVSQTITDGKEKNSVTYSLQTNSLSFDSLKNNPNTSQRRGENFEISKNSSNDVLKLENNLTVPSEVYQTSDRKENISLYPPAQPLAKTEQICIESVSKIKTTVPHPEAGNDIHIEKEYDYETIYVYPIQSLVVEQEADKNSHVNNKRTADEKNDFPSHCKKTEEKSQDPTVHEHFRITANLEGNKIKSSGDTNPENNSNESEEQEEETNFVHNSSEKNEVNTDNSTLQNSGKSEGNTNNSTMQNTSLQNEKLPVSKTPCMNCRQQLHSHRAMDHSYAFISTEKESPAHLSIFIKSSLSTERLLICPYCYQPFQNEEFLNLHNKKNGLQRHTNFVNKGNLKKDVQDKRQSMNTDLTLCSNTTVDADDSRNNDLMNYDIENCYLCYRCYQSFSSKLHLENHLKHCEQDDSYICVTCHRRCSSEFGLRTHIRFKHLDNYNPLQIISELSTKENQVHQAELFESCLYCSEILSGRHTLVKHIFESHLTPPYTCAICSKTIQRVPQLYKHFKTHFRTKGHNQPFVRSKYLRNHLSRHNVTSEKKPINILSLPRDLKTCFKTRNFTCAVCNKFFRTFLQLKYHLLSHNVEFPSCRYCSKSFITEELLEKHMVSNLGKPECTTYQNFYECDHCSKIFNRKHKLREHVLTILNTTLFTCSHCCRSFREKSGLRKHMLVHSLDKPFRCAECSRSYTSKPALWLHVRLKHNTEIENESCFKFNKICSNKYVLKRHSSIQHGTQSLYYCFYCNVSFSGKRILRKHIFENHIDPIS